MPSRTLPTASAILIGLAFSGLPVRGADPTRTAIRFGAIVVGEELRRDAVVVVEGDRIAAVTTGGKATPPDARVIDLRKYTAIPGLIDAHTHLTYYWDRVPGTDPWRQTLERRTAVSVFLAQENARRCLDAGVTTVRDLGSREYADIAMRELINHGAMPGPRMFVAGHGLFIHYESAQPEDAIPYPGVATGPVEMMRVVRQELFGAGTDVVKIYGSRGSGGDLDGTQTFTYPEIQAAVDAAHALGARVAVHSYGPEGARDAVRAGADSIEHAVDLDDETLAEMVRRGTFYVPTIDHNRYYAENHEIFGYGPEVVAELRAFIERNVETARRAHAAGVRLAMGSDALFTMFGENTRELAWLVKAGLSPAEALAAATRNGAELLGKGDELGALAPGRYADVVAVEGNPLEDIGAVIDHVVWVMKGGTVVSDRRPDAATAPSVR